MSRIGIYGVSSQSGAAYLADLVSEGALVYGYARPSDHGRSVVRALREQGGIQVDQPDEVSHFVPLLGSEVGHDLQRLVQTSDLIVLALPSIYHEEAAAEIASVLPRGRAAPPLVLSPSRTLGAPYLWRILGAGYPIVSFQTCPYACKVFRPGAVYLKRRKRAWIASAEGRLDLRCLAKLHALFPEIVFSRTPAATSLGNVGAVFHPTAYVLNQPAIQDARHAGRRYSFYMEGIAHNPVVGPLVEEVDQIRLRIADALGCSVFGLRETPREAEWRDIMRRVNVIEVSEDDTDASRRRAELLRPIHNAVVSGQHWLEYTYGVQRIPGESLPHAIGRTPNFMKDSFPQARYADEDVATGLVPLEALAQRLDIDCTPITRVIDLYDDQSGHDARRAGRNLRDFDLNYLQRYLLGEVECLALCVLATLGDDPHTQGLFRVARIARKAGLAPHVLPPGSTLEQVLDKVQRLDPGWLGFSYRLSPEIAVRQFRACLGRLAAEGLLRGTRRIAVAGLPEAMRAIDSVKHELPCEVWTMPQDLDLARGCERVLHFFDVPEGQRPRILEELRPELFPARFTELDELAREVAGNDDYRNEPPLAVPSPRARASYVERIREMDMPLLRTHFGIPAQTIAPTVEGIKALSEAAVVDEISLGSSDLSQRHFGDPAAFIGRKNDGGVPYSTFEHLVEMVEASRRGNFPGMKPYAHVADLVPFVDTCLRAGMLTGSHQAVPLFWFNELDGRGPMSVGESIREHQATVRALARRGIPVEMNDPNHFSSRWAHDTIIAVDYALITAVMLAQGVEDLVLQLQFNKPRETSDHGDLAKMLAGLDLAGELLEGQGSQTRLWRETRTGIDSFDPDVDAARHQLARSTFLQLLVNPHAIHLVSYCEALHVAGVDDVIDSSRLVRRCVRVFRRHARDLLKLRLRPAVVERRAHVVSEAKTTLRHIAALDGGGMPRADTPLAALTARLADPASLLKALERGVLAAPGIFHPGYAAARDIVTAPIAGRIECLDPQTGAVRREAERLASM